ncbi:MAG: FlgO family outer membrane protein [Myxococcota bacterium]
MLIAAALCTLLPGSGPEPADAELDRMAGQLSEALVEYRDLTVGVPSFTRADGKSVELGGWVASELSSRLAERFTLVERVKLNALVDEDALAQLQVTEGAGDIAKRAGVDLFVLGNVTRLTSGVDVNARVVRGTDGRILFTSSVLLPKGVAHAESLGSAQASAPLTLSTLFLAEREIDGRYEDIQVRNGSILRTGDGIKISFEVNRDAFVYAILLDSGGTASLVFPDEEIRVSNSLPGGQTVEVPSGTQWFGLDDSTGTETIFVFATLEPVKDMDALLRKLEELGSGKGEAVLERELRITRGFKKKLQSGRKDRVKLSNGEIVTHARELLSGSGAVVRTVQFQHR